MTFITLEFRECTEAGDVWWIAETPIGTYEFHAQEHSRELECVRPERYDVDESPVFAVCSTPILAIRTCQRDFERIISACLVKPPQPEAPQ